MVIKETEAYDSNNGPSVMREMSSRVPDVTFTVSEVRLVRGSMPICPLSVWSFLVW